MKKFIILLPLIVLLITSCEKNEYYPITTRSGGGKSPTQTVSNTITFSAADWLFGVGNGDSQGNPNNYQHTLITSTSGSGLPVPGSLSGPFGVSARASSYSLGIGATTIMDTASLSYWYCRIAPPATLRVGQSLTLKAKVRLTNIQGKGISVVIRGDRSTKTAFLFATTEGKTKLTGTADFTEYSIRLPYSAPVDTILLYLTMLPRTTGTVSFSDVYAQID